MKNHFLIACIALTMIFQTQAAAYDMDLDPVPVAKVPVDEAGEIIDDIIAAIGLKPNFDVRAANIPNAAAVAYNGKRYIMYNPQFIVKLNAAAGNKWASVSVLAHEIGHHLNGHTLKNIGSHPSLELEADEFSGFILRRMGATLAQSQEAMRLAASYKPSLTHPGKQDRLDAIAAGWNNAAKPGRDMAKYGKPVPQTNPGIYDESDHTAVTIKPQQRKVTIDPGPTYPSATKNNRVLPARYILGRVNFQADQGVDYYVTIRYNLVKVMNGRLYIVGKMLPTDNRDYPFIMRDNQNQTLFVDRSGKIVTSRKQVAGYLRI